MDDQYEKALFLGYFTVGYNVLEAAASIFFESAASSIALVGFGSDSIVESLSGLILIWRLRQHESVSLEEEEGIEKKAIRFVGHNLDPARIWHENGFSGRSHFHPPLVTLGS